MLLSDPLNRGWLFRLAVSLSCFCFLEVCSQPAGGDVRSEKLDTYLQQVLNRFEIPGLTIAITENDRIIYTNAFGVRSLDTGEVLKPEHIFHMASVSKPFVATAIVQLVEQGKMDLDERLVTYLPYFKLADERYREITIRQMLSHTSGMPDVRDYEWDIPQYDDGAAERYVRSLADDQMIFSPGEGFRYSNMAFDVLGDVIAKVSGQPFEIYVKENILNPLGMKESNFLRAEIAENLRTSAHIWDGGPVVSPVYPYNRRHAPSSTLNSSVLEMTNWALANLNKGELKGVRILQEKSYDLLWTPTSNVDGPTSVGLSWFVGDYKGEPTISHGGGDTGYRSYFVLLPEKNIGVILASNYDQTPMGSIREGVLDIILGHEPAMPKKSIALAFGEIYARDGFAAAKQLYYKLQRDEQENYRFGHGELNGLGYVYLRKGMAKQAIEVFEFNVALFPDESNPYDSLGEACMVDGQKEKAIVNYEKSLELNPENTNAVRMLEKLRGER